MPEDRPLDLSCLPAHIGIIMDGNGRWARSRGKIRTAGHKEGLKAAKRVVKMASDLGIRCLTLYAFSTENWKRAEDEVFFLMKLIRYHLRKELKFYLENRVRVIYSGHLDGLPSEVRNEIVRVSERTANLEGLTVNLAINYGGRDEIVRAVNRWLASHPSTETGRQALLTEESLAANLDQPDLPEPDLIIRTGQELRTSNFLLWEGAYAELLFSNKMWPEWRGEDLLAAVQNYQERRRRFGGHG